MGDAGRRCCQELPCRPLCIVSASHDSHRRTSTNAIATRSDRAARDRGVVNARFVVPPAHDEQRKLGLEARATKVKRPPTPELKKNAISTNDSLAWISGFRVEPADHGEDCAAEERGRAHSAGW